MAPRGLRDSLFPVALFGLAFWVAYATRAWITLPYSNPEEVVGMLVFARVNPLDDPLRFGWMLVLPFSSLLLARRWIAARKDPPPPPIPPESRGLPRGVLVLSLLLLVFVCGTFNYDRFPQRVAGGVAGLALDTYHEGESLGFAVQLLHGQAPYRDTAFFHGAVEDPLRALFAFRLFGRSIASLRIFTAWLHVLNAVLLFLVVRRLFSGRSVSFVIALCLLWTFQYVRRNDIGFTVPLREVTLLSFLLPVIELRRWAGTGGTARGCLLFFAVAAVAAAAGAYSVDRGIYLLSTSVPVLGAALVVWAPSPRRPYVVAALGGYATGFLLLGWAIQWEYAAMYRHVFQEFLPLYGLLVGEIYPFRVLAFWFPVLLIAANISWLAVRYLRSDSLASYVRRYGVELTLGLLSIFFFRNALNHAEIMLVWYSCAPAYLLSAIIVVQHGLGRVAPRVRVAAGIVAFAVFLHQYARIIPKDWGRLPEHVPDSRLIPDNYREAIAYLEPRLPPGASLYTLTNEATWFYFVDRPCPTRFPVVYFAGSRRLQDEVIDDLEAQEVAYIVFDTAFWSRRLDGVVIPKRVPLIFEYVRKHYAPDREFDGLEIWKRNDG